MIKDPTKAEGIFNLVKAPINSEYDKVEKNDMKINRAPKILRKIRKANNNPSR